MPCDWRKAAEAQLIEAEARQSAGSIAGQQADYARAEQHFQRALELFQRSAERRGQGEILISLGVLRERRGDLDAATAHYRRGKEVLTEIGDLAGRARALLSLGVVAHQRGDDAAKAYYQDALSALDGAHNPVLEARVLSALADEHVRQDNIPAALDAQVQALDMFRRLGDRNGEGWAQIGAGTCLLAQGQLTAALSAYEQAMAIFNETGDQLGTIDALNSLGDTLRRLNREDDADGHYRRARDLALATGDQPEYDRAVAGLAGRGERFPSP
jgi:tetratricopeptide (TPR) repeat protein